MTDELRKARAEAWDEGVAAVFAWWATPEEDRPLGIVNPHGLGLFPEEASGD